MTPPLRFCFGLHLHQPVGNFDSVFEQHLTEVYRPLLGALAQGDAWPVAIHLSGPLLEWLEDHAPDFLDVIGTHVAAGRLELLCAGHDEPILAVLPREDRREQLERHREYLRRRFGVEVRGLWLTERVWEPNLPEDLASSGVDFVLVDDRHFRVTGFSSEQLHAHFMTESGGHRVHLFPIDEKLRYLIPFRPPTELVAYLRGLRDTGCQVAVLGDDGEKFGGWPGTRKWVYQDGWMDAFVKVLAQLRDSGEVVLSRFDEALAATPSAGLAYLPSASYREMEGWSLPPAPARALHRLELAWGEARLAGLEGGLLRGGHWRNFLAKYPESNRLHKAMLALSSLCRERGDPPDARRAIGRAQCNDAYWHGVFGGLYLPHLRAPLWAQLADAERLLREGEPIAVEALDFDADGHQEQWVHSGSHSALVAPARGGAVEMVMDFAARLNLVDVMTRHREAYHEPLGTELGRQTGSHRDRTGHDAEPAALVEGTASIHDVEGELRERPAVDRETRAWFVDRLVAPTATVEDFLAGTVPAVRSWARTAMQAATTVHRDGVEIYLRSDDLAKTLHFAADGAVTCAWAWQTPADGQDAEGWFTSEISSSVGLDLDAAGATVWQYQIETVAKSEKGFDRTVQGTATVLSWPVSAGSASVTVRLRSALSVP